ncbi:MAG: hypothetical protein AAFY10_10910 [Pseudomonadota bacterium]
MAGELSKIESEMADPSLFERDPEGFNARALRLESLKDEQEQMEEDWLQIEAKREQLHQ